LAKKARRVKLFGESRLRRFKFLKRKTGERRKKKPVLKRYFMPTKSENTPK